MKKILAFAFATLVMFACAGSLTAHPPNEMSQKECIVKSATADDAIQATVLEAVSFYTDYTAPNFVAVSFSKVVITDVTLADSIPVRKSVCNNFGLSTNKAAIFDSNKNSEFHCLFRDLPLQVGWCNC